MPAFIDLTGKRFSRWLVLSRVENNRHNQPRWNCLCDCGKEKYVVAGNLTSGVSKSCGCLNIEVHRAVCIARNTTHGLAGSPEHITWVNIRQRCENPKCSSYEKYGAKGISVCERWQTFENFLIDMGKKPTPKHTIDRFPDCTGNYEPGNCRWATMKQQQANRRHNVFVSYQGETLVIPEWSRRTGIAIETIRQRIKKGWTLDQVFAKGNFRHKALP